MRENRELIETVLQLIQTGREDDWWDFKQSHQKDKAELLHDIICMANSRSQNDGLLIFGIQDKTMEIIGCETDPNRRNQQHIVELLRSVKFAGQIRPRVEVRTITIRGHEIDVFIVKNTSDTPYYLIEDYVDRKAIGNDGEQGTGRRVLAARIYCRVMDNNTPINGNADLIDIESLWKKRFGLLQTPLEQLSTFVGRPHDWIEEDESYYHKQFPQFTLKIIWDVDETDESYCYEENPEFYHYVQTDHRAHYGMARFFHYGTQLFSCQVTGLDGHRACVPCPIHEFLGSHFDSHRQIAYRYYLQDSIQYKLLLFLTAHYDKTNGNEASISMRKHLEVVLVFQDAEKKEEFDRYIISQLESYKKMLSEDTYPAIVSDNPNLRDSITTDIRSARILKRMQREFCQMNDCRLSETDDYEKARAFS